MQQVKGYYDEGFFKSVVFVSRKEDLKLAEELEELTSKNNFKLGNIDKAEAVRMVRKRIGNLKFISDQNIIKIFSKDNNTRAFLKNCEDACRYAFESGSKGVTDEHIQK